MVRERFKCLNCGHIFDDFATVKVYGNDNILTGCPSCKRSVKSGEFKRVKVGDKDQTPLTDAQVRGINVVAKGFYVGPLMNYPNNGVHLGVILNQEIPFAINRNADPYILKYDNKGEGILHSNDKWVVVAREGYSQYFAYNKEFDDVFDAVEYAVSTYIEHLEEKSKRMREWLKNELSI